MLFPKRNLNNLKGVTGQAFFQYFVNNHLKCIYHPINQENDFGIDSYIELVVNESVSGKLIGVQLKHGDSFFRVRTDGGYKYVGENKHLNYYLNSQSPIFIVIMDEDFNKMYWTQFDIMKTTPLQENNWWIEVPIKNELYTNFRDIIFKTVGPIIDFEEQIQINWSIDAIVQESKFRVIAIPKGEIAIESYSFINNFMEKLSKNKEMLINSRSTLDIFFPEYDNDSREIFQIPEIMDWLKISIDIGVPWFYFLDYKWKNTGLNLLVHSYCRFTNTIRKETGYLVEYNNIDLGRFIEKNFINMNIFMDKNNINLEINKEISDGIFEYFKNQLA